MNNSKTIPKEIKEQILARIKQDNIPAATAAREHGVSSKTVYSWLERQANEHISYGAWSRLKKENQQLKELVGRLIFEIDKEKTIKKTP